MNASEAIVRLRGLGAPVVTTAEASKLFGTTIDGAAKTLARLARAGVISKLRHGTWAVVDAIEPHLLPEYLTSPLPSYVSLQTALYHHGMVSQIPAVIYAVSLARRQLVRTSAGTFSIHHVAADFFGGFEVTRSGAKLATPEKALMDVFYLTPTSTRLFARLPELTLPKHFRMRVARSWIARVRSTRLRTLMTRRLDEVAG